MTKEQAGCRKGNASVHSRPPAPTSESFREWLEQRSASESRAAIGASLGVTAEAVRLYLKGMRVSGPVLLLAGYLMREPREMAAGLPDGPSRRRAG